LIEFFPHFGINGNHCCSVYEVMGPTLLDLINFNQARVGAALWGLKDIISAVACLLGS
jgi:hypothetical protein